MPRFEHSRVRFDGLRSDLREIGLRAVLNGGNGMPELADEIAEAIAFLNFGTIGPSNL